MESYVRLVVRRRFLVLALLGLMTVASGVVCSYGRIGTSLGLNQAQTKALFA